MIDMDALLERWNRNGYEEFERAFRGKTLRRITRDAAGKVSRETVRKLISGQLVEPRIQTLAALYPLVDLEPPEQREGEPQQGE